MSRYAALFSTSNSGEGNESGLSAGAMPDLSKPQPYQLLFVDDEPQVLSALKRIFSMENYIIFTANSGNEALALLEKHTIHLVMSDYRMPGMSGSDLLTIIKERFPQVIRIMLTGNADAGAVMGAVNDGAVYKFILKPWDDNDLRITVALALEQCDLIRRNKQLQSDITKQKQDVRTLSRLAVSNRSQLAIMLRKKKLLTDHQAQELHKWQEVRKEPMLKILLEKDWVDEEKIRNIFTKDFLLEEVSLPEFSVDPVVADLIPSLFCIQQSVIPLKLMDSHLLLAVADPLDAGLLDDLRFMTGLQIDTVLASMSSIKSKVQEVYGDNEETLDDIVTVFSTMDPFETVEVVLDEEDGASLEELLASSEEPPAVRLVNAIVIEAARMGVSDIHIQPLADGVIVRYRIDGILLDKIRIPSHLHRPLVSRIKIMAELDISERRFPQDGRITVKTRMRIIDLRISTLPTINGEKVVIRILDRNATIHSLDQQGFTSEEMAKLEAMVKQPQGIILATGPTGSGKTTTLYSLLRHGASPEKNYVTIEDPVEYYLDIAGQVSIHNKIDLNFAKALRAILRQDPDVILLGEIRDFETAEVSFQAAMTGHQVLSTLHCNSVVDTVARLIDLNLKPYIVASGLTGIIAQRLIRRICQHCKEIVATSEDLVAQLGAPFDQLSPKIHTGTGCYHCNHTGYKGRIPIFEILLINDDVRALICDNSSHSRLQIHKQFLEGQTLWDCAYRRINDGITSLEEVIRVLGPRYVINNPA